MNHIKDFDAFMNEGKLTGSGARADYQMENANNGLRSDSIFISTDRFGSKNTMNIKISMYSGGSDGIDLDMPKKLAELNDTVRAAFANNKDKEKMDAGEVADEEKAKAIQEMQKEIFDAVAKELDAFDKKLGTIVADVVKKY